MKVFTIQAINQRTRQVFRLFGCPMKDIGVDSCRVSSCRCNATSHNFGGSPPEDCPLRGGVRMILDVDGITVNDPDEKVNKIGGVRAEHLKKHGVLPLADRSKTGRVQCSEPEAQVIKPPHPGEGDDAEHC